MFPTTDSSQTIIDTLLNAASQQGVEIRQKEKVFGIKQMEENGFMVQLRESDERFDAIILATGSSRDGYEFLRQMGHCIVDPVPSLFTLNAKHLVKEGGMLHGLSGVSVPNARLTFKVDVDGRKKKHVIQQEGPLLITHHGLSGPAALRLSAFGARELYDINYQGHVSVNWAPELGSAEELTEKLCQFSTISPKRAVATVCPLSRDGEESAIPKRLWSAMVAESGLDREIKWCEAPKKKLNALARLMCEHDLEVTGKGVFKEEFVTAGGVSLKEIDMKTMASKLCPGLFLCGEIINVDGVTGGFNFMNCWSTGWTAGNGAAEFVHLHSTSREITEGIMKT
jgi:predicted Rossmann fold flavoprotein